jgi:hypothetical protein
VSSVVLTMYESVSMSLKLELRKLALLAQVRRGRWAADTLTGWSTCSAIVGALSVAVVEDVQS